MQQAAWKRQQGFGRTPRSAHPSLSRISRQWRSANMVEVGRIAPRQPQPLLSVAEGLSWPGPGVLALGRWKGRAPQRVTSGVARVAADSGGQAQTWSLIPLLSSDRAPTRPGVRIEPSGRWLATAAGGHAPATNAPTGVVEEALTAVQVGLPHLLTTWSRSSRSRTDESAGAPAGESRERHGPAANSELVAFPCLKA